MFLESFLKCSTKFLNSNLCSAAATVGEHTLEDLYLMQLASYSHLPLELNLTTCEESGFEADAAVKLQGVLPSAYYF